MGRRVETKPVSVTSQPRSNDLPRTVIVVLIALIAGFLHYVHVDELHENSLFFSHLSSQEREMTFPSEAGFYYSYFKQLILAPTLKIAWNSLLADPRTEYPTCWNSSLESQATERCGTNELNAMQRFNLYPELFLAMAYRLASSYGLLSQMCYRVNRVLPQDPVALVVTPSMFEQTRHNNSILLEAAETLAITDHQVTSCQGLAEPSYFYIGATFLLAAFILLSLVWSGWSIASASPASLQTTSSYWLPIWGALLPAVAYFFNHREVTRVQWIPPLRENFAYPFFTLQQAWLLYLLSNPNPTRISSKAASFYCMLLLAFQVPWQFAQFALATQVASLFAACCITTAVSCSKSVLVLIDRVHTLVFVHLLSLLINFGVQFGNGLLISSGYPAGLIGVLVGLWFLKRQVSNLQTTSSESGSTSKNQGTDVKPTSSSSRLVMLFGPPLVAVGFTLVPGMLVTRLFFPVSEAEHDGGHIFDILREKFHWTGKFRTFHTRIYTCAPEFDFMKSETIKQPLSTALLPMSVLASVWVLYDIVRSGWSLWKCKTAQPIRSSPTKAHETAIVQTQSTFVSLFVVFQLFFFSIMAILIMRLKLFWMPQLCLVLALLAQPSRWERLFNRFLRPSEHKDRGASLTPTTQHKSASLAAHILLVLLLAYMSVPGSKNLQEELKIRGEFNAYANEALVDWFKRLPSPTEDPKIPWVIAGPISTLGSLRLMLPAAPPYPTTQLPNSRIPDHPAGFALTNHPHYENAELRRRTVLAYSIFSRQSLAEVWHIYRRQLQADFVIVDLFSCKPRRGCSNPELFDLIQPHLIGQPALCETLLEEDATSRGKTPASWNPYFQVVFADSVDKNVVLYVRRKPAV